MKILLVEDYPFDVEITLDLLKSIGFSEDAVMHASTLRATIKLLEQEEPDLILLDLGLPDSKGMKTFETIHSQFPAAAIVVFSGLNDQDLALESVKKGAQDYLVKGKIDNLRLETSIRYSVERKRLEQELVQAKKQAEAAYAAKKQFLASISHDLKNPLNSILALSDFLARNQNGHLDEKELAAVKTIHGSGNDLLEMITDLMAFSKVDAGKLIFQGSSIQLASLIEQLEKRFLPLAHQKQLELEILIENDVPEIIYTDNQRLKQIIQNLLSNGIKFTSHGKVSLLIRNHEMPNNSLPPTSANPKIEIIVADTGIGIPQERFETIFQAFEQGGEEIYKSFGGSGLGLSIVQKLTKLLAGEVHLESKLGKGSIFRILLPVEHPQKNNLPSSVENEESELAIEDYLRTELKTRDQQKLSEGTDNIESPPQLKGKHLLIVDDNMRNVYTLLPFLEDDAQMRVTVAPNGQQALEKLQKISDIELVLMDIHMPIMDGYQTMRAIRKQEHFIELPIIVTTGFDLEEVKNNCSDLQVSAFLKKPLDIAELFRIMGNLFSQI